MQLPLYQLDAFTDRLFTGNPAAVCPLDTWLDTVLMQQIAAENNLSETAFFTGSGGNYELRWFTPQSEIDLCGHATLATAEVIFTELEPELDSIRFSTRSGELIVNRLDDALEMDFPALPAATCSPPPGLAEALGIEPLDVRMADDYLVICASAAQVQRLTPDMRLLQQLPLRGIIVSARGDDCDFVSRFFAPKVGIDEDPVTGSAHCILTPYWAGQLGKSELFARQLSPRGGSLHCRLQGDRVFLRGQCRLYLRGTISVG